jgi:Cu+-exporting ATPase
VSLRVTGLHCTNCALSLEKHLLRVGANAPAVDYATGRATFSLAHPESLPEIVRSIDRLGYTVTDSDTPKSAHEHNRALLIKTIISAALTAPMLLAMFMPHSLLHDPWLQWILATPVFIIGALHFGASGFRSLRAGVANMDVLIALGIFAGYTASVVSLLKGLSHETIFFEATSSIVTFVLIGHLLEDRAVRKTTSAIESLASLRPHLAVRVSDNGTETETVSIDSVKVGDLLQVNTGDTIPTDGVIESGGISCNETMISGEALPVDKTVGARVIGGSIALEGSARIRATAVGDDTTLSMITRLVSEAHQRKPKIQRLGDAVSAVFVPGVIVVSLLVLSIGLLFFELTPAQALVRALAIAVVACPCAMGLATPTAIMVALGRAATSGILIRGGDTLERLATISQIGFDKTGTLTTGDLKISQLKTYNDTSQEQAKSIIVALQRHSSHPIAKALVKELASPNQNNSLAFTQTNETRGVGIEGTLTDGTSYICGGKRVMERFDINVAADLVLVRNGQLCATLNLEDTIRSEASNVLKELSTLGIASCVISGDTPQKTQDVAEIIGVAEAYGGKLPHEKLSIIRDKQLTSPLAYVGDGINDAPTLTEASVGVSLSSASDVAMHSAQVILSDNSLRNLPAAIRLARITVRTIKQNLFWAFFYNILAIPLAALGYISPLAGALLMTGSDVIIVANSLRIKLARISSKAE